MSRWPLWLKIAAGVFVVLMIMSLVGNLGGSAREESYDEGFAAGVASVTPPPTPEPLPEPTPQVVTETIEVAPAACLDAIEGLMDGSLPYVDFFVGVYDDYLDYPDENLADFGRRVEERMTVFSPDVPDVPVADIDACRAAS